MEVVTAFVLLGLIALAAVSALVWVCVLLCGLIVRQGNQLTANSGHQLERIKYEAGAEAVRQFVGSVTPQSTYVAPEEKPDFVIPNRG